MKGKIIKIDKEWKVEIQSDLHGYGIGWGDHMIYPLFITDENIWEGKEVEVEPIQYDSNFLPVIVKIKTNNMVNVIFRAKRIDNDEWVEGFFTKKQKSSHFFVPVIEVIKEWDSGDYIECYEVDGDTVEQA